MASHRRSHGRAYQTVALIIGHVWWQACWQCLLKDWHVTLPCCIIHSSRKSNDFGGLGIGLDGLVAHDFESTVSYKKGTKKSKNKARIEAEGGDMRTSASIRLKVGLVLGSRPANRYLGDIEVCYRTVVLRQKFSRNPSPSKNQHYYLYYYLMTITARSI